jgi:hypothetical protein
VDENLLQQLQSGENIHIVINPLQHQKTPDLPANSKNAPLPPNLNSKGETSYNLPRILSDDNALSTIGATTDQVLML